MSFGCSALWTWHLIGGRRRLVCQMSRHQSACSYSQVLGPKRLYERRCLRRYRGRVCRALQACFACLAYQPGYRISRREFCRHTPLTFFNPAFVWVSWDSLARFHFPASLSHTQSLTVVLNEANLFKSNSFAVLMIYRLILFTGDHEACPVMLRCPR